MGWHFRPQSWQFWTVTRWSQGIWQRFRRILPKKSWKIWVCPKDMIRYILVRESCFATTFFGTWRYSHRYCWLFLGRCLNDIMWLFPCVSADFHGMDGFLSKWQKGRACMGRHTQTSIPFVLLPVVSAVISRGRPLQRPWANSNTATPNDGTCWSHLAMVWLWPLSQASLIWWNMGYTWDWWSQIHWAIYIIIYIICIL